jgi:hypothetical protein
VFPAQGRRAAGRDRDWSGRNSLPACIHIMRAQGTLPKSVAPGASNIQIITPFNMPA